MASNTAAPEYDPKNMRFRRFGDSGLRVSLFSLGGWLTLGGSVNDEQTKEIMKAAFECGINTFDTAEAYSKGESERSMGKAIKELGYKRSDLVLITKLFFGMSGTKNPNGRGLSRKHIVEGANDSLSRAGLEYWDVIMAHRPDVQTPMVEVVKAFNHLISTGKCFYWGVSTWSVQQIQEAIGIALQLGLDPPLADQSHYSALFREPVESAFTPLYEKYKFGIMSWSPLEGGILTGKYSDGIPEGSRIGVHGDAQTHLKLDSDEFRAYIAKAKALKPIADDLGCSTATLSLAWVAANPNVSTVIIGASKLEQLRENVKAMDILDKLTPDVMSKIEDVLQNKPAALPTYGR